MEPFDTVKIKKKGVLASVPAEETASMQLFSQRPHLVESAAKQEVEVSSAYWYGRNGTERESVEGETEIMAQTWLLEQQFNNAG